MAGAYGEETGKVMTFLTGLYGVAPQANLTLWRLKTARPTAIPPRRVFLSPRGIGSHSWIASAGEPTRAPMVEHAGVSISRDHMWIENGKPVMPIAVGRTNQRAGRL